MIRRRDLERPNVEFLRELRNRLKTQGVSDESLAAGIFPQETLDTAIKRMRRLLALGSKPTAQISVRVAREYAIGVRDYCTRRGISAPPLHKLSPSFRGSADAPLPLSPEPPSQHDFAYDSLDQLIDALIRTPRLGANECRAAIYMLSQSLRSTLMAGGTGDVVSALLALSQQSQRVTHVGDALRQENATLLGRAQLVLDDRALGNRIAGARLLHERGVAMHNCRKGAISSQLLIEGLARLNPATDTRFYVRTLCDLGFTSVYTKNAGARRAFAAARDRLPQNLPSDLLFLLGLVDAMEDVIGKDYDATLRAVDRARSSIDPLLDEIDPMWRTMLGFSEGVALSGIGHAVEAERTLEKVLGLCHKHEFAAMSDLTSSALATLDQSDRIVQLLQYK